MAKSSHESVISTYLDLLGFLVCDPKIELGIVNIKKLWRLFVEEPNYSQELTCFLRWINRAQLVEDHYWL
jgi:hypothetical protein